MKKYYAVLSGCCASAASVFGKLCGLPTIQDYYFLRLACFLLMLSANAFVLTLYVKALQASTSTLSATVLSAAANYLISGLSGFLIFNENISSLWWTGAMLILSGLLLIVKSENKVEKAAEEGEKTANEKEEEKPKKM